ncbi:MAG TPA: DUF6492 family protein [Polyangiaceae bacterium]|nr:DUF6492 family protein [Polyangiaceae bacterium]
MQSRVDLVLPVNPASRDDQRRMGIALASLARYLDPESVGRLLVVVPDGVSLDTFRVETWDGQPLPFQTVVRHDRDILGVNPWRRRVGSWFTQQFVKLGAAEHLESDFFVTLDADVLLTRPTRFTDLIVDGRASTLLHERRVHEGWWRASAEVLGTEPELEREGMGVTPAILSRDVACALIRYLEARYDGPWYRGVVEFLDDQKARGLYRPHAFAPSPMPTEYSLYFLFAEMMGCVSRYHVKSDSLWCQGQVFRHEELDELPARLQAALASPGRFFVLQSVLGPSPEWVWERVSGPLGLGSPSAAPVTQRSALGAPFTSLAQL